MLTGCGVCEAGAYGGALFGFNLRGLYVLIDFVKFFLYLWKTAVDRLSALQINRKSEILLVQAVQKWAAF